MSSLYDEHYDEFILDAPPQESEPLPVAVTTAVEQTAATTTDWAARLSRARQQPEPMRSRLLTRVATDFEHLATQYGKIIVSEYYTAADRYATPPPLPPPTQANDHRRSIQPLRHLDGVAGGLKFVVANIFFKLAQDSPSSRIYGGSDELAAKAAGSDLRSLAYLTAALESDETGISFPLQALIDYCGHRLIAVSRLPLAPGAPPAMGSADGGRTVFSDPALHAPLSRVAARLNLRPHLVRGRQIFLAADVEVNRGTDGQLYMLDYARCFPPEHPEVAAHLPRVRKSIFWRLLRPELVLASGPRALSADALSRFGAGDPDFDEHCDDVAAATCELLRQRVPDFARALDSFHGGGSLHVVNELHRRGINVRHLGLLRSLVRNPAADEALLVELLARGLKALLRACLRAALRSTSDALSRDAIASCVVRFLNLVVEPDADFWARALPDAVTARFGEVALRPGERARLLEAARPLLRRVVGRLLAMVGVSLTPVSLEHFHSAPFRFTIADVADVTARVKTLDLLDRAYADQLLLLAGDTGAVDGPTAERLYALAVRKLESALLTVPGQAATRRRAGEARIAAGLLPHMPPLRATELLEGGASILRALAPTDALLRDVADWHSGQRWSNRGLLPDDVRALARAVRQNGALTNLDLSHNKLTHDGRDPGGIVDLAKALVPNDSLRTLSLASSRIGDAEGAEVCGALARNRGLRHVNLADNELGAGAATRLAEALPQNGSLVDVDLGDNPVPREAALALATAVFDAPRSSPLRRLNLRRTGAGSRALRLVELAMECGADGQLLPPAAAQLARMRSEPFSVETALRGLFGVRRANEQLLALQRVIRAGGVRRTGHAHVRLLGPTGTGRRRVADALGRLFHAHGLLELGHVVVLAPSAEDVRRQRPGVELLAPALHQARGGVLVVKDAAGLSPALVDDVRALARQLLAEPGGWNTLIVVSGGSHVRALTEGDDDIFPHTIAFDPLPLRDLAAIAAARIQDVGLALDAHTAEELLPAIFESYVPERERRAQNSLCAKRIALAAADRARADGRDRVAARDIVREALDHAGEAAVVVRGRESAAHVTWRRALVLLPGALASPSPARMPVAGLDGVFVVDDVLSREACAFLIEQAEGCGFSPGPGTTPDEGPTLLDWRTHTRVMIEDPRLAAALFSRLPPDFGAAALNERLRYFRYEPGQLFGEHSDDPFRRPGQESRYSVLLYLNDDFSGGFTRFEGSVDVQPRAGRVLIYAHPGLPHEGLPPTDGVKYCVRSDLMFSV